MVLLENATAYLKFNKLLYSIINSDLRGTVLFKLPRGIIKSMKEKENNFLPHQQRI